MTTLVVNFDVPEWSVSMLQQLVKDLGTTVVTVNASKPSCIQVVSKVDRSYRIHMISVSGTSHIDLNESDYELLDFDTLTPPSAFTPRSDSILEPSSDSVNQFDD
jgi:hypothetical protein